MVEAHSIGATYLHEPEPGIAQARNRAIEAALPDADWIAFVDDDEIAAPNWLSAYEHMLAETDIRVVTGPVDSRFPPGTPEWVVRGGFVQKEEFPTGPNNIPPSTSNTIVHASVFHGPPSLRFNPAFGLTGGSDTEFFIRVRDLGIAYYWCQEARVATDVPPSRTTARWIWARGLRKGNAAGRIELARSGRAKVLLGGIARVAYGTIRIIISFILGHGLRRNDARILMRGIGFIEAGFGKVRVEYTRKTS